MMNDDRVTLAAWLLFIILAAVAAFSLGVLLHTPSAASQERYVAKVDGKRVVITGKRVEKPVKKGLSSLGAGLIGAGVGFLGGRLTAPPTTTYVVPARPAPQPVYRPEPWSAEWYNYCANRYRSFDARTGYYTTYSGYKRFCQ